MCSSRARPDADATVPPVPGSGLPSFDLVVATVDRTDALDRLLDSLERQTHRDLRVLVVDQNADDRLDPVLAGHPSLRLERLRSPRGLSRARNAALPHLAAHVVGFPDDDCAYPDDLLERVAQLLGADPALDGVTGRAGGADGSFSPSWPGRPARLGPETVWNRANSHTMFLRRELLERTGGFDESLGLGAGTPWHSGEEIELLVRALRGGARVEYDPSLVVLHPVRSASGDALVRLGARDGASVGYVLAKHRFPARTLARMLVRPLGGAALALARGDLVRARFHAATLRGRLAGWRGYRSTHRVRPRV